MLQHADHVRFGEEHLARDALAVLIAARIDVVHLDGDVAAVVRIVREIHDAGAAAADLVDDHVLADLFRQRGATGRGLRVILGRMLFKGNRGRCGDVQFGGAEEYVGRPALNCDLGRGSAKVVVSLNRGARIRLRPAPSSPRFRDAAHRSRSVVKFNCGRQRAASSAKRAGRHGEQQLVVVAGAERPVARLLRAAPRPARHRDSGSRSTSTCAASPLAAASFGRSPASPSDRSMAALAMPRAAAPNSTRGVGYSKRSPQFARRRGDRALASDPVASASPAPASPSVPVTASRSPACAPPRRSAVPRGDMTQDLHADGERPGRGVAADQRHAVRAREVRRSRARKPLEPVRIGARQRQRQGRPRGRRAHRRQVAQIHRERAVADGSGVAVVREMPAGDDGVHRRRQFRIRGHAQQRRIIAHAQQHVGSRTAQAREVAAYQIEFAEMRSVATHAALFRGLAVFVRPQLLRGAVQYRVHELVPVGRAESLGELNRLRERDPIRQLGCRSQARADRATAPRARSDRARRAESRRASRAAHRARRGSARSPRSAPENTRGRPAPLPGPRQIADACPARTAG